MQGQSLPLEFEIHHDEDEKHGDKITFLNGEERLETASLEIKEDSVFINMVIFDAYIAARIENDKMTGIYNRAYKDDYILPFQAIKKKDRFNEKHTKSTIKGRYRTVFTEDNSSFQALGLFKANNYNLTGTFITETGDYRYLEGVETIDSIFLSAYDGEHLFLFKAEKRQDSLIGGFWSGSHYYADWVAVKNETYTLKDPDSLTYLKSDYEKLTFSFPDISGDTVSLSDYKGRPVIVQLLGTWCPNCMDETNFLAKWYRNRENNDIEVLGLAYETKNEFSYAVSRVNILKEKLNVTYPILIAGSSDKASASKTLPMLSDIISFPTTIFLNRNHDIVKIHTGFSGPGTGAAYQMTLNNFNSTIEQLSEK